MLLQAHHVQLVFVIKGESHCSSLDILLARFSRLFCNMVSIIDPVALNKHMADHITFYARKLTLWTRGPRYQIQKCAVFGLKVEHNQWYKALYILDYIDGRGFVVEYKCWQNACTIAWSCETFTLGKYPRSKYKRTTWRESSQIWCWKLVYRLDSLKIISLSKMSGLFPCPPPQKNKKKDLSWPNQASIREKSRKLGKVECMRMVGSSVALTCHTHTLWTNGSLSL